MNRVRLFATVCVVTFSCAFAQEEAAPAPEKGEDLATLRQTVEQQSKKIEILTQEVSRLVRLLETRTAPAAPAAPADPPPPPAAHAEPASAPTPDGTVSPPKAMLASGGTTHTVTKGETLTSIAKLYKVGIGELKKVNKIENERTLQIGQSLIIPPPKTTEQPSNP